MTSTINQMPTSTRPVTRTRQCTMDIWDTSETLRIYADRTVHRRPCRRYQNANSWGLGEKSDRYTGSLHSLLLDILKQEIQDNEDYTDRMYESVMQYTNSW